MFVFAFQYSLWYQTEFFVNTWRRHQMETFSALLAICAGNSPVLGEFPAQRPTTRSLMFYLICVWINGWVNNREAGDLRRYRAHYDVTVMIRCVYGYIRVCRYLAISFVLRTKFFRMTLSESKVVCLILFWNYARMSLVKAYIVLSVVLKTLPKC